ncbi:MAG: hypothetical protein J0L82_11170 [Deltaproteobacteria bacterium]|jgi:hypothetical protein|nr:hypothetical protein [Deltaproteobacteria bacterium]
MPIRIEFGVLENSAVEPEARTFAAAASRHPLKPQTLKQNIPEKKNSTDRTWIAFELLPGPFQEQWAAAFAEEISRKSLWHFNFGSLFVDEPYYRNKITRRLKTLREIIGRVTVDHDRREQKPVFPFAESDIAPYCKRTVLEGVLKACSEIKSTNIKTGKLFKAADDLEDLVRHYLQIYHPEFHFHISLQAYVPQTYHLPPEARTLFTCDRKDGWLYLDYVGDGQNSLACFNEKSITEHEPENLFSANSQILYRENFDGHKLQEDVTTWLKSKNQSHHAVGLIPLARPLHTYSRIQVRELFRKSDTTLKIRIFRDGQAITSRDLLSIHSRSIPFFAKGPSQAAAIWLLRKTSLDLPVNVFVDCYHRYGGTLGMIKQPYYWLKPKAFKVYFTLSWPIRHLYYIDWPTVTKVAWGRALYSITLPFHLIRPHAFQFYFTVSRPIRKAFYFAKFQFEKRILRIKK